MESGIIAFCRTFLAWQAAAQSKQCSCGASRHHSVGRESDADPFRRGYPPRLKSKLRLVTLAPHGLARSADAIFHLKAGQCGLFIAFDDEDPIVGVGITRRLRNGPITCVVSNHGAQIGGLAVHWVERQLPTDARTNANIESGASKLALSLSLALPGDYDGNGVVNALDYTMWRDSFDSTSNLTADGNRIGAVDAAD